MLDLKFKCLRCGRCCHEISELKDNSTYKRIPLYPEEADLLEELAEEKGIMIHIIEDIVFPDTKNTKIQVLTYRIMLDNPEKVCPFYDNKLGCTIQESKPQACLAYPLSVKTVNAFNMKIEIDPFCNFTIENYDKLSKVDGNSIKEVYDIEYDHAKGMLKRNKRAIYHLLALEKEGKIIIPRTIEQADYDKYLKEWDRIELSSLENEEF